MASAEILERFEPLDVLTAQQPGFVYLREVLLEQEVRAQAVHDYYGVVPTIGCEVEVQWSTLHPVAADEFFGVEAADGSRPYNYRTLPPRRREAFLEVYSELDKDTKRRFDETRIAGIPSAHDAYWEFAQRPSYHWDTVSTETQLLMHAELIPEGYQHSLHVTLGGLALGRGGVNLLIPGIELVSGTPERIVAATKAGVYDSKTAWNRKGDEGVRERNAHELELGITKAVELRSLVAVDRQQVGQTLRVAQMMGAVLLAYRIGDEMPSALRAHLADRWSDYVGMMQEVFRQNKLPTKRTWGSPGEYQDRWLTWADCIKRRQQGNSMEAEVAGDIMEIVRDVEEALEVVIC